MTKPVLKLTPAERSASIALAGLFACRMLGLFLLMPVFAVAARALPGGDDPARVGLTLGMYGLTQACMQIPLGLASDRWGRRPVVLAGLLLYVAGSVICALSHSLLWIDVGRAIQGSGAISAAITAWLADSTRAEVRARAMGMVGASIGLSFALALVLAPLLMGWWGLPGLFWTMACLGLVCLAVARFVVPVVPLTHERSLRGPAGGGVSLASAWWQVLKHADLLRLNFGVFVLHLTQVALFVVVPPLLARTGGLDADTLWKVYLPVILLSFVLMPPVIIVAEKRRLHRGVLLCAVAGLVLTGALLPVAAPHFFTLVAVLVVFFVAFNVLEALQPSLVSRVAPPAWKGLALGAYNTAQSAGLFAGGALGGTLTQWGGTTATFIAVAVLAALWLLVSWRLKPLS